ncbi:hypothetical protein LNQ81_14135 [Myroides sp. M-43]|uniref:hypothetical protein n=1 Tax=Myroides oncorhynchi TaxID=2893756 RepID=UPI001E45FD17|nr:hypothetical protein [Myroides oncorhynchi]MCC9043815.1 hypothetical protein [Myroides oncorhynchi]
MIKNIKITSTFLIAVLVYSIVLLSSFTTSAQVRKTFTPRVSSEVLAPYTNVKNYNLQGDFLMLGNTSMTLDPYVLDKDNSNNYMKYVDIDNDNSTVNSSSAELVLPGGDCTEIIYAGLYWSGRAHDGGNSNEEFLVNGNHRLNKRKVRLKKQGDSYRDIWANSTDLYYPSNTDGNMYSAYADITSYVREKGAGNYTVADLALIEGNGGGTGFYGGWGMVIIYKNTSMKWRDITVFDGHAYVAGGNYSYELPISGFKATQHGNVNVTLGLMAGEGDRMIQGDYFEIKRGSSFDKLKHNKNTTGNFFNSSIAVGDTPRSPNLVNNTGYDIAKFDLDNSGNKYIANNATNATFRYGSTQDTYVIYNIVFAVDAYVPDIVGENKPVETNGKKPTHNGNVEPGQELEFELDVYNKGTEAVNNSIIEIPVPFNLHYNGATIKNGLPVSGNVSWRPPVGGSNDPSVTAGGTIIWNIGSLPEDQTKELLLAQLKYRFKVSDNCILLSTNVCGLGIKINGKISGVGATSNTQVNSDLVRDYGNGLCAGPVYDDFESIIEVSTAFKQNCNPPVEDGIMQFKAFCSVPVTGFNRDEIIAQYPIGSKFYNVIPSSYNSTVGLVSGNFAVNADGSKKMYFVMVPGMEAGCYAKLEISVERVTSSPLVKNLVFCQTDEIILENQLSLVGVEKSYNLYYFDLENNLLSQEPKPSTIGTHKYLVAEGKDGCFGPKVPFQITINQVPEVSKTVGNIVLCENFDQKQIVTTTTTGVNFKWEYNSTSVGGSWQELTNSSFTNVIRVEDNKLEVNHATKQINGLRIRLKVTNTSKCSDFSNEFSIRVEDCSAVTNPMLLNPGLSK